MKEFEYYAPGTVAEACAILAAHAGSAAVLAGGTDLLVKMKHGKLAPQHVVHLINLRDLDYVRFDEQDGLRIGAMTLLRTIERHPLVQQRFPILVEGCELVGSIQVRHLATIAGNSCNASPAADTAPALICLGASARIVGPAGERTVEMDEFFTGPGQTVLRPDEIVTELHCPTPPAGTGGRYLRFTIRRALDLTFVGVGVQATMKDGICESCRIALGAVAPTPVRARQAEAAVVGKPLTAETIAAAAAIAPTECRPISDVRCSAEYRRKIVGVYAKRALESLRL